MKQVALAIALGFTALLTAPAFAANETKDVTVTINLTPKCQISTPGALTFAYDSFQAGASTATIARPVVTIVSHATRECGSSASNASSTASEIWSATLSGWPSVTDSEEKRWRCSTVGGGWGMETRRAGDPAGPSELACRTIPG